MILDMKRIIVLGLVALFLIVSLFIVFKTRPSGDINDYQNYYTSDSGQLSDNAVKVTFFGVSTLLFDDGETQFLIDGFFSRSSIWRTLTTEIESDTALIDQLIAGHKINRVRGIFVTHSHYDHAFDVAYTTKKTQATLYGSRSTLNIAVALKVLYYSRINRYL
jgi:glyoxylase-like metal-dependent hydrolase (beta-lactamase superfamily II)